MNVLGFFFIVLIKEEEEVVEEMEIFIVLEEDNIFVILRWFKFWNLSFKLMVIKFFISIRLVIWGRIIIKYE